MAELADALADKCVFQEVREPLPHGCDLLCLLQFLPRTSDLRVTPTPRRPTRAGQRGASRFNTVITRGSDVRLASEGSQPGI